MLGAAARGPAAQGRLVLRHPLRPDFAALDSLRSFRAKRSSQSLTVSRGPKYGKKLYRSHPIRKNAESMGYPPKALSKQRERLLSSEIPATRPKPRIEEIQNRSVRHSPDSSPLH
jgi:hypothetical protein